MKSITRPHALDISLANFITMMRTRSALGSAAAYMPSTMPMEVPPTADGNAFLFHRGENADVRDATSAATTHDETDSQVAKRTGEASGVGEHESAGGRFHRRVVVALHAKRGEPGFRVFRRDVGVLMEQHELALGEQHALKFCRALSVEETIL